MSNANNFGQRRAEFQVVVAGSSGWMKSSFAASIPVEESSTAALSELPTATAVSTGDDPGDTQHGGHVSASAQRTASLTLLVVMITLTLLIQLDVRDIV